MQESDLVKLIIDGDQDAFKKIFDQNQSIVINTCYHFINNKETAEDLTQDVFVEVYRSIKNFRNDSKLSTWIYRIAVTKSIDYLRAQKRKKRFAFLRSLSEEEKLEERISNKSGNNPDKDLESADRIKIINWALNSLSENQRAAFTLCRYNGFSYKETAEILGTTVPSVESLVHRAKKNLEKKLYKYYKKII